MRKLQIMLMLMCITGVLAGCTNYSKQYDANTLIVNKNGSLVEVSVENFKDSSVDADSISTYVEEQIESYNDSSEDKIKMKSIDADNIEHVKLVLSYKNIESYDTFNLLEYTLKDIGEVKESDLTGSYTSSDDKKTKPSDIMAEEKCKVLTISEATDVAVKGNILYYNGEVSVKDGIATTSGKKDAVIVFR